MRRLPFILGRSVVKEALPPFSLAVGVTTFLLVIRFLFSFAELLVSRDASTWDVVRLLLYSLPHVLALTLPMGLLFAAVLVVSRWSSDSEVVALAACGTKPSWLSRPLATLGLLVFLLDAGLSLWVLPEANRRFQELTRSMYFAAARAGLEPRVFNAAFTGQLVYVDRIDSSSGQWQGILVFDLTDASRETLITAEKGLLLLDSTTGELWLSLQQATVHTAVPQRPDRYQRSFNAEMRILLQAPEARNVVIRYGPREASSRELWHRAHSAQETDTERRESWVELHKRLALPAAAFFFSLLGFPLGVRNRRGGKGYGLTVSVLVVVGYYILLNNGELLARSGKVPIFLGVWLPNLMVLLLAGLLFRWQGARPSPRREGPGALLLAWQELVLFGKKLASLAAKPLRGNRARSWSTPRCSPPLFLGCIDRWVLGQTLRFFLLVLLAVCGLYVAVNFSEQVEEIQRNNVPLVVVASFYLHLLPQVLHDTLPLAFLIAVLGTTALLEKHNETVALKAAGISLRRLAAPLVLFGGVLSLLLFFVDETVVQRANRTSQKLEDVIKGRKGTRNFRFTDQSFLFLPDGRTVVSFLLFDSEKNLLVRPSLYVLDERLGLRARWFAQKATFINGTWVGEEVWNRTFLPDGSEDFTPRTAKTPLPLSVKPEYFRRDFRKPSQMSFSELAAYIRRLQTAGYKVDKLLVQLHQKLAYPLSLFLLPWLALPYAFRLGRRGTVMGIATALVLAMAYFSLTALMSKLGEVALLPPVLAAWAPTITFFLLGLNRQVTLRT
jgi:LPS export ABC transporter permease LptG/LPS export ABC transporter permease LptF